MDWPMCRRVERQAFVRERQGETYLEARAACLRCPDVNTCLNWLDGLHNPMAMPDFCPNLPLFLRFKRVSHRSAA